MLAELDVLVHDAGVLFPGRVGESTADEWRASFEVNVTGAVALTLALLPALRAARGHVVFINSGAGRKVSAGMASYSASKFALRAFADSLRADEPSLRVTSVFPGAPIGHAARTDRLRGPRVRPGSFLRPETVAGLVASAVNTPRDGHVHEIVVRPG